MVMVEDGPRRKKPLPVAEQPKAEAVPDVAPVPAEIAGLLLKSHPKHRNQSRRPAPGVIRSFFAGRNTSEAVPAMRLQEGRPNLRRYDLLVPAVTGNWVSLFRPTSTSAPANGSVRVEFVNFDRA